MTRKRKIALVIIICCSLSIIIGAVMSSRTMIENSRERRTFEQLEEMIEDNETEDITDDNTEAADPAVTLSTTPVPALSDPEESSGSASHDTPEKNGNGVTGGSTPISDNPTGGQKKKNRVEKLKAENAECIGWISISGTNIDYPLMHSPSDPEKYLSKNFYGKKSSSGVPFLDARCDLANSDNLLIYGHRMKNGTMFSALKKYRKQSFWKKHPTVTLELEDGKHYFYIFSVMTTNKLDTWYRFVRYLNEEEYDLMMSYAGEHSLYDTGITPHYGDRLVSLSSCYGSGKDGRIIIVGMEA